MNLEKTNFAAIIAAKATELLRYMQRLTDCQIQMPTARYVIFCTAVRLPRSIKLPLRKRKS